MLKLFKTSLTKSNIVNEFVSKSSFSLYTAVNSEINFLTFIFSYEFLHILNLNTK